MSSSRALQSVAPLRNPDRMPPHSLAAEMHVLGACTIYPEHYAIANELIGANDFYALAHETIWRAIAAQLRDGKPTDAIAIAEQLRAAGKIEMVGGLPYLRSLTADIVATEASTRYYATLVREKSLLRNLITAGLQIAEHGYEGEIDVERAIAECQQVLHVAIEGGVAGSPGTSMRDALARHAMQIERALSNDVGGVQRSPFPGLNSLIGGFKPGNVVVWTAPSKAGKTGMLATIARFIAERYGGVNFHSLELSIEELTSRFLAQTTGISEWRQTEGKLSPHELEVLALARGELSDERIALYDIEDTPSLREIFKAARMRMQSEPLAAIIIDHVGYLREFDVSNASRAEANMREDQRLEAIYKTSKRLAVVTKTVVHVVVHVNRNGLQENRPPTVRDVRGGGNPDGHAATVIALYRPNPAGETRAERDEAQLIVLATRIGEPGTVPMTFVGYKSLWLDPSDPDPWHPRRIGVADLDASANDALPFEEVF